MVASTFANGCIFGWTQRETIYVSPSVMVYMRAVYYSNNVTVIAFNQNIYYYILL
jgi:hypothetical protein